jgi:glycerol-3-phosphate dehydrogenase (NAD+)
VIARIVGANTKDHNDLFHEEVKMYVYEEVIDGKKLSEIINTQHENVKYLPGFKLPDNIVSNDGQISLLCCYCYFFRVLCKQD